MNKAFHRIYLGLFFIIGISVTIFFLVNGYDYYITPIEERFFHASHSLLKPSGYIGHGLGIIGSIMMLLGVLIYMIRKRVKKFAQLGILKYWLEFHIFLCTVGPILVLFHTAFKFGGIVAVSFWNMAAVVLSGVIGRFIYIQIPKTIQGKELDIKDLDEINNKYTFDLRKEFNVEESILLEIDSLSSVDRYKNIQPFESILIIIKESITNKILIYRFKKHLIASGIPKANLTKIIKIIRSKLTLIRRIGLLKSMQKLFRYWHIIHLPFAITMFTIMLIHVIVTIIFGCKWIF